MRKIIPIAIALVLISVTTLAWPSANCSIKVINLGPEKLIFRLYWVDYPQQDMWPFPLNIAGGELDSDEHFELSSAYPPGDYYIEWYCYPESGDRINAAMDFSIKDYDSSCILAISSETGIYGIVKMHVT